MPKGVYKLSRHRECYIENHVCKIPLQNGEIALCDEDRFNEVNKYNWSTGPKRYPSANTNGKPQKLHKFLYPEIKFIDHINGNKLDNRSCNLREADKFKNMQNKGIRKDCKSGFKGVYLKKEINRPDRITAEIRPNHKKIFLGYFETFVEAARAYDRKAIELFGEWARPNFPREEYDGTI